MIHLVLLKESPGGPPCNMCLISLKLSSFKHTWESRGTFIQLTHFDKCKTKGKLYVEVDVVFV